MGKIIGVLLASIVVLYFVYMHYSDSLNKQPNQAETSAAAPPAAQPPPTDAAAAELALATEQRAASSPVQSRALDDAFFVKSPNDERTYHAFVMDNGLEVLLISDPKAQKSAASLDVARGSSHNPPEWLGMAHYLEHMLFLGTEKYPEPDGFQEFIAANGGSYNAYTAARNTNYFFDVRSEHFAEALDRFADFFIAPLFNPDFAERERNVVDSEFHLGLNEDGRRYYAVLQEVFNPAHPMSRFNVGNLDTLGGAAAELIGGLREFYALNYRTPLMKLVLFGNEDLESLRAKANRYFTPINAAEPQDDATTEPLILPENLPSLVQFQPMKEAYYLDFYFPIAAQEANYDTKPAQFIAYLFTSDNLGSLEDYLKMQGWSNGIYAGTDISLPEQAIFNIHVSLTPAGNERVKEISSLVFAALEQVKQKSREEWRYAEVALTSRNDFQFKQSRDGLALVRGLSRTMQRLPAEKWLSSSIWERHDQSKIDEIMAALSPDNMMLFWVSPAAVTEQEETYYKVPYSLKRLNAAELSEYHAPSEIEFLFPPENPFLGSDLQLLAAAEVAGGNTPQRLTAGNINGWYMFNDSFKTPRAELHLSFEPVGAGIDPQTMIYYHLFAQLVNDKVAKQSYQGALAGYSAHLGPVRNGLRLKISGYNDKLALWTDKILDLMTEISFEQHDFERILANIRRGLRNRDKDSPAAVVRTAFNEYMQLHLWQPEAQLAALEGVTLAEIESWGRQLFTDIKAMAFVYGNISPAAAAALVAKFEIWPSAPLTDLVRREWLVDLSGEDNFIVQLPNQKGDSAVLLYHQAAGYDYDTRVKTSLLAQLLRPQFFLKLRTEQELGYLVSAYYTRTRQKPGLAFIVQSNRLHSKDVLQRMHEFIAGVPEYLQGLSAEEFENYKLGLINELSKPPQNFGEEFSRYRYQIAEGFHEFDDRERAIAALQALSQAEIITHAAQLLRPQAAIAFLTDDNLTEWEHEPDGTLVTDPLSFKQQLGGLLTEPTGSGG